MKLFLTVFAAILAAALVISLVKFTVNKTDELAAMRSRSEVLKQESAAAKAEADWYNDLRKSLYGPTPTPELSTKKTAEQKKR